MVECGTTGILVDRVSENTASARFELARTWCDWPRNPNSPAHNSWCPSIEELAEKGLTATWYCVLRHLETKQRPALSPVRLNWGWGRIGPWVQE